MSAEQNTAPILAYPIPDKFVVGGAGYSFAVPFYTFYDPDPNDQLLYCAVLGDGSALPAWLTFDPGTLSFTATPDINVFDVISVRLTATDLAGAQVTDSFNIEGNRARVSKGAIAQVSGPEDGPSIERAKHFRS